MRCARQNETQVPEEECTRSQHYLEEECTRRQHYLEEECTRRQHYLEEVCKRRKTQAEAKGSADGPREAFEILHLIEDEEARVEAKGSTHGR